MEDFSCTRQVITHGLVDSSIGARAQWFSFNELLFSVSKLLLGVHCPISIPIPISNNKNTQQLSNYDSDSYTKLSLIVLKSNISVL